MTKLEPCPFCGGDIIVSGESRIDYKVEHTDKKIVCYLNGNSIYLFLAYSDLIDLWNKRSGK